MSFPRHHLWRDMACLAMTVLFYFFSIFSHLLVANNFEIKIKDIKMRVIKHFFKLSFILTVLLINVKGFSQDGCTDIIVGKDASIDGSVITSHTGCCSECRIIVIPAKTYKKGEKAPVYYGFQDVRKPYGTFGEIIGYIPQAEKTYAYFFTG